MAKMFGYARVSTTDQDLTVQLEALKKAGCDEGDIREEKASGTSRKGRSELEILLTYLRQGDTLVVTRIDRLARSMKDLQDLLHELKGKGATLKATEQSIDTSTPEGKCFFDMLGAFAEFETNLRKERQLEGIAKAKKQGVYKGGSQKSLPREQIIALLAKGMRPSVIARDLGISRLSVYRVKGEAGITTPG